MQPPDLPTFEKKDEEGSANLYEEGIEESGEFVYDENSQDSESSSGTL